MKAIILAAGKGSRLGEFNKEKPKCLLELGDETILSREVRMLVGAGLREKDVYIVAGYKSHMLIKIAPNLIYNSEYIEKDNSYSLGLGLSAVENDDVLVLDGDLCFEEELLHEVLDDQHENVLLTKKANDERESTGVITDTDGRIRAVGKQYRGTGYVYLSIFKIGRSTAPVLRDALLTERVEKTWYTSAITEICDKYPFYNKVTLQKWHEIDFVEDYIETLEMFHLTHEGDK